MAPRGGLRTNDGTIAERVDGAKSSGQANRIRERRVHSPAAYSIQTQLDAMVACRLLWDLCEDIELVESSTGRRTTTTIAAVMVVDLAAVLTGSIRSAVTYLNDPATWKRLVDVAEEAWPDNPAWRLPPRPASRSQHCRFRKRHLTDRAEQVDELRELTRRLSVEAATEIDLFNSGSGSFSRPSREQTIAGDATYVKAAFNTNDPTLTDPITGEVRTRRVDDDATWTAGNEKSPGYHLVDAVAQGTAPGQRIILDAALRPHGTGDGAVFCDLVEAIQHDLSRHGREAYAATYDMALYPTEQDRLLNLGLIPVAKVPLTGSGERAQRRLGPHTFTLSNGTHQSLDVIAVDGTPHIEVPTTDGLCPVMLERAQTKRRRRKNGAYEVASFWRIPDQPVVAIRLVGATARIRNQSTRKELNRSTPKPRTRTLRVIPPSDPSYREIFGTRESTESMHQHWKATLVNKRARTVGANRLRHAFHCYQMSVNITTLLRHAQQTDNWDMFGAWRPPQRRLQLAA